MALDVVLAGKHNGSTHAAVAQTDRWFIFYYINKSPALRVRNPPPDPPIMVLDLFQNFNCFDLCVRSAPYPPPPLLKYIIFSLGAP